MLAPDLIRALWEEIPEKERSRCLWFNRFADPSLRDGKHATPRRDFFVTGVGLRPQHQKSAAWRRTLRYELRLELEDVLFARLESRLLLNMAGGVMENAGLCLDRFGYPCIAGSAIKGSARRLAIQELAEKASAASLDQLDPLARLLADVALVFGWAREDWEAGARSDFAYAIGRKLWPQVFSAAGRLLTGKAVTAAKDLGHFAGSASFLPAYPWQLPLHDLELDVLTCHHPAFYGEPPEPELPHSDRRWLDWKQHHEDWRRAWGNAPDTEEPIPVTFPAVAKGIVLAFVVLPLRGQRAALSQSGKSLHALARDWLTRGLAEFGLGAKTAAGYGWFDTSDEFQRTFRTEVRQDERIEDFILRCEQAGGFVNLPEGARDELLLELADNKHLCQRWHDRRPKSFKPILEYATQQSIPLL